MPEYEPNYELIYPQTRQSNYWFILIFEYLVRFSYNRFQRRIASVDKNNKFKAPNNSSYNVYEPNKACSI